MQLLPIPKDNQMPIQDSAVASVKRFCATGVLMVILFAGCINDQELEFNPDLNIPPTCSDGLKNQDETAIDCGGACSETCGDKIVAACSAELKADWVYSPDEEVSIAVGEVYYSKSYGYNNLVIISAFDENTSSDLEVVLPISELPAGNMQFLVAEQVSEEKDNLRASVTISPNNGSARNSVTGTVYLRTEGRETIYIEFCKVLFKPENPWYDQNYYNYSGQFSFLRSDTNF